MAAKKKDVGGSEGRRDELLVVVGARIKELRGRAGITQKELGEAADVTQAYIYLVEVGGQNITLTVLDRIAAALGVSILELLEGGAVGTFYLHHSLVRVANGLQRLANVWEERGAKDTEVLKEIRDLAGIHEKLSSGLLRPEHNEEGGESGSSKERG